MSWFCVLGWRSCVVLFLWLVKVDQATSFGKSAHETSSPCFICSFHSTVIAHLLHTHCVWKHRTMFLHRTHTVRSVRAVWRSKKACTFLAIFFFLFDFSSSLLTQQPLGPHRHCGHRPPEPRPTRGKLQTDAAHRKRLRQPQAEHRTRAGDRRLDRHPAMWPPQRPIGGRDQPVGRGGLGRLRVSGTALVTIELNQFNRLV